MALEVYRKTSTANLVDSKKIKELKKNPDIKKMDSIIALEKIIDNYIIRSQYGYAVILKISTTDINLLCEEDLKQFEMELASFAFGLNFQIKFARSNEKQSFKKYKEFVNSKSNDLPDALEKYKKNLFEEFSLLEQGESSNKKSNYIYIVSPKARTEELALKNLKNNLQYVKQALSSVNIHLSVVAGKELINVFYRIFNRGIEFNLDKLIESNAFSPVLFGTGLNSLTTKIPDIDSSELNIEKGDESDGDEEFELEKAYEENSLSKEEKIKYKKLKKANDKKYKKQKALEDAKEKRCRDILDAGKYSIYDVIKPGIFKVNSDYIKLGTSNYVRMLSISTMPQSMNILSINDLCFIENMEIVCTLKKLDERNISTALRNSYSKLMSNIRMKYKDTGTIDYDTQEAAHNVDALRKLVETNSDKLFHTQILIKIWSNNLKDLENKTQSFIDECAKRGMVAHVLFDDQEAAFKTSLPSNCFEFKEDKRNVTSGGASCLVPSGCTHLMHKEGIYMGRNVATNATISLDKFLCQKRNNPESQYYSNPNMYICGKPGAGKSTLMKVLLSRGMLLKEWNAIFDMEHEYKKICEKVSGKYLMVRGQTKIGINPLEISVVQEEDSDEKYVPIIEKEIEITNLINNFLGQYRPGKPLAGTEIGGLQKAVETIYRNKGITKDPESLYEIVNGKKVKKHLPILSDLRNELSKNESTKQLAEIMLVITGEGTMSMFDCETSSAISNFSKHRFLVFCLKELDDFTKFFAMTTILSWLWGIFSDWKYKGIQKNTWIDEGWRFAKDEASLNIIEDFSRRGRKYWSALIIATQSIQEFLKNDSGKAIINLCSTKIIMKQDAHLARQIADFFGLPNQAAKIIPSFSKGRCVLVTETGNYLTQIDMFSCEREFAET